MDLLVAIHPVRRVSNYGVEPFVPGADINATTFFKDPFASLILPRQLTEFTVMDIEPIRDDERFTFAGQGAISKKVSGSLCRFSGAAKQLHLMGTLFLALVPAGRLLGGSLLRAWH